MLWVAVTALAVLLALPALAAAQNGFEDFRQAADNQYGNPEHPHGGPPGQSGGGPPPGKPPKPKPKSETREVAAGQEQSLGTEDTAGDVSPGRTRSERGSGLPLAKARGGRLPFTGLDLGSIALAGVALLGSGIAVRAATRRRVSRRAGASG